LDFACPAVPARRGIRNFLFFATFAALCDKFIFKHNKMNKSPLEIALKYMDAMFSGQNMEELAPLLCHDFSFQGPLFQCHSAEEYIEALKADPPVGFKYKIIHSFQSSSSVALFYLFSKPGIQVPMAQLFEFQNDKICRILLIFDSSDFTQ
jgi:hypothetical protein